MAKADIWVVKLGSSLLLHEESRLNEQFFNSLATQLVAVRQAGKQVILVSSGSVAIGRHKLGISSDSSLHLPEIQAAAAIGQSDLMGSYSRILGEHGILAAQLLLTHYDFQRRKSYLNTRTCLRKLLELGCLPIINENDTLMDEEVCFGDNDTLAAMTANLISASMLVILTDIDGVYTANPRHDKQAKIIREINADDPSLDLIATGEGGGLGKGGMLSKIKAARLAAQAGATTVIATGISKDKEQNTLTMLINGENPGSKLTSKREPALARKRWLAGQLRPLGSLGLDNGAAQALQNRGVSLLPVGVVSVSGSFDRGDPVSCCDEKGVELARGLVNYSSGECHKIKRLPSDKIGAVLGYEYEPELIHRDNLALV
ncbi:MAG: glutamate 5-kinase [Gammaproteobacteria bacterium]|nr:glutamate 5-kinase [Gammaproteobacteria bacterium]